MDQKCDLQSYETLKTELSVLQRRVDRERAARKAAEELLEEKSQALYRSNQELVRLNENLERNVLKRTSTLAALIQNLNAAILVEDEDRRIVLANDKLCEYFEIPVHSDELIGLDCSDSVNTVKNLFVDPEAFEQQTEQLITERKAVMGEILKMKNGRVLERDFLPTYLGSEYLGNLWKYRDITQSFYLEEKLRHSEEKYRGIIENMQLGLLEVDLNHNIVRAYDRFCDMTGFTKEELQGRNAIELMLPSEYQGLMDNQTDRRQAGEQGIYEIELRKKDGSLIWVMISGAPIFNDQGAAVGSIGIHYDITSRKMLENDLREAREIAENAREAEKQFLANMSHEIRNPINAIAGLLSLLYDTKLTVAQLEYLDNIKYSADILLGLISDVLDISKIEAGKVELLEKEMDMSESVKALIQTYRFKTAEKGLTFTAHIDERINSPLIADPTVINQILLNLIGNAVKFTESGCIHIEMCLLEDMDQKVRLQCSVTDTGIGIEEDQLKRIFESFSQASKQTKLKYGGTGLGLSIVRHLVRMYNGEVTVESELGKGSTFKFTMELSKSTNENSSKRSQSVNEGNAITHINHVLVVEDNKINQMYLTGLLQKWGITYDLANHGKEAIDFIEKQRYDLVLMDIRMPVMDGYETTIRIRSAENNPNKDIPIIALTASALVDERDRAIAAGMNHHLTKPFSPDQLLSVLDQLSITVGDKEEESGFHFSPVLDVEYLESFYQDDLERAGLMFEIFLKNIDQEIAELKSQLEKGDIEKLTAMAHRIKPNFIMVGLKEQSEKMKIIEQAGRDRNETLLHKIVPEFFLEFEIKKEIVENELGRINAELGI